MHDENRFIWELAPIGLAKVEQSGKFHAVNPRFCELTGYSETELLRRTFQDITHPDDVVADSAEAANLSAGDGNSYQMVKRYISKDGRTVWVSLYVHAIREAEGVFRYFLAFAIELRNVYLTGSSDSTSTGRASHNESPPLWDYVKKNPKQAAMVAAGIATVAAIAGERTLEFIKSIFVK